MENYDDVKPSSFLTNTNEDPLPINLVKVSQEEILEVFPNIRLEEIEKLQEDLIRISQIIYNYN